MTVSANSEAPFSASDSIAVVGIGCRLPGGANCPQSFWKLLLEGQDAVGPVPSDRWDRERYTQAKPSRARIRNDQGGFIKSVDLFDHEFFNISPREAEFTDPQQRLLLEVAWESLEDSGTVVSSLDRSRTGVFVGMASHDYSDLIGEKEIAGHMGTGTAGSIAANRLSNYFDFKGPSLAVDTACSSGLVAFHLACQSLRTEECDLALVGASNLILSTRPSIAFSQLSMLSPTGRCRSFDASADGYVRGEGVIVFVLKPLTTALRDRNQIYGLVAASGVNQDGKSESITIPSELAQASLLEELYTPALLERGDLAYLEAHGTGTPVGDPIEAGAIGRVLGRAHKRRFGSELPMGSVKTNIGHLETASGLAGLLKGLMVLHHRKIPPNLHFQEGNPQIPLAELGLGVPTEVSEIRTRNPLVGVNNFGFGGTNAHVVLAAGPRTPRVARDTSSKWLLPISAHCEESLVSQVRLYRDYLEQEPDNLSSFFHTACLRRTHHSYRSFAAGHDLDSLIGDLERLLLDSPKPIKTKELRLGFVFCGQGSQWWSMGRGLMRSEPVFRATLERCDKLLRPLANWSLLEELERPESESNLERTDVTQATIFAIQVGLTDLLSSWGVKPQAIVGHSVGEVAAAYAAGVMDLEDAVTVIHHRGRAMTKVEKGIGGMLAVAGTEHELGSILQEYGVCLSAINSPRLVTIAGKVDAIEDLHKKFEREGRFCRRIKTDYAFHSKLLEDVGPDLIESLQSISPKKASVRIASTVTGEWSDGTAWGAEYHWRNVRGAVRFSDGVKCLLDDGIDLFLEIGPHPVLHSSLQECADDYGKRIHALSTLRRDKSEDDLLRESLGKLFQLGYPLDWEALYPAPAFATSLPTYPWNSKRHWLSTEIGYLQSVNSVHPILGQPSRGQEGSWENDFLLEELSYLRDHRLDSAALFPAAGYVELALAAARQINSQPTLLLEDVQFSKAWFLDESGLNQTRLETGSDLRFRFSTWEDGKWLQRAGGRIMEGTYHPPEESPEPPVVESWMDGEEFYQKLNLLSLNYGRAFQTVDRWQKMPNKCLAELKVENADDYFLHPCILDGCLQLAGVLLEPEQTILPVGIRSLRYYDEPGQALSKIQVLAEKSGPLGLDLRIWDEKGRLCVEIEGLEFSVLERASGLGSLCYQVQWLEGETLTENSITEGPWMVLGEGVAAGLLRQELAVGQLVSEPLEAKEIVWLVDDESPEKLAEDLLDLLHNTGEARLWIVTSRSQGLTSEPMSSSQTVLWGMARVARREISRRDVINIELCGTDLQLEVEALLKELVDGNQKEVALRGDERLLPRLQRINVTELTKQSMVPPSPGMGFRLTQTRPGEFENLCLQEVSVSAPCDNEVEVAVHFAGLNFSDVLKALGIYPGTPGGPLSMGLEFSGVVTRIGPNVKRLKPGDRVLGLASESSSFSSLVTVPESLVVRIPDSLSLEAAATLPVAYMTVFFGLGQVADLSSGERLLVHSATGGVGRAAIAYAHHLGAKVYATAGTPKKRELLKEMGVEWVGDSRSLNFHDEILQHTKGEGVEVVLNSLVGEAMEKSLSVLTPRGRFVELGKRDYYENTKVGLAPFRFNLSYTGVDLEQVMRESPEQVTELLTKLVKGVESGWLEPIPWVSYPVSESTEAFRLMAAARHKGRVILDFTEAEALCLPKLPIDPKKTYLITGGLGGLGLLVAEWLADKGARHLSLLSRSGRPKEADHDRFTRLTNRDGLHVEVSSCDVSEPTEVERVLKGLSQPLGGIFHLATVFDDAPIEGLNKERLTAVIRAKASSAWILHEATKNSPLTCFVLFGSFAAIYGSPGQLNYAGANAYLNGLAQLRKKQDLPATVVDWGSIGGVGHVARHQKIQSYLGRLGVAPLRPREVCQALEWCLQTNSTHTMVARIDWSSQTSQDAEHLLGQLVKVASSDQEQSDELLEALRQRAAQALGLEAEDIPLDRPLSELGLDSLMAFELRTWLQDHRAIDLPAQVMLKGPSLLELVSALEQQAEPEEAELGAEELISPPVSEPSATTNQANKAKSAQNGSQITVQMDATEESKPAKRWPAFALKDRPALLRHRQYVEAARAAGISNPFFFCLEGRADSCSTIDGRDCINLASYNYLGLAGHPEVRELAKEALDRYGCSVSASRLVSGERPIHQQLERELADFLGVEDSLTLVGGHATNTTLIPLLVGPKGLILHDALAHDCIVQGAKASRAMRRSFVHNDLDDLERLLEEHRPDFRSILVGVEGLYSMDGDGPDLPRLLELQDRYGFLLLVDEAHSIGVTGSTGRGLAEVFGLDRSREDVIWMGTLSKAMASCGGYLGGSAQVIDYLRYNLPGFVFSVGMPPASAASALGALRVLKREPERVEKLHQNTQFLLKLLREGGVPIGGTQDSPIIPIVLGDSYKTCNLSQAMLDKDNIHIPPIAFPAVPEGEARLRLMVNCEHTEAQLRRVAEVLSGYLSEQAPSELAQAGADRRDSD